MPKLVTKKITKIIKNPSTLWSGVLDNLEAGGRFPPPYPPPPWAPCRGAFEETTCFDQTVQASTRLDKTGGRATKNMRRGALVNFSFNLDSLEKSWIV